MAIQDSINGIVSSVAQGVGVTTGLNKLKESNEYAKSNAQIAKAQNEVQRINLSNELDKFEGDMSHEVRKASEPVVYNPTEKIPEEDLMKYAQDQINLNEKKYFDAADNYQSAKIDNNDYRDELKDTGIEGVYEPRPKGQIQSDLMLNGKWQKKSLSDMEAANLATKTWKDKLTTMQTLRKQINILGMKDELEDKKGVK